MKDLWNQRYKEQDYVYGKEPNAFFKEQIEKLEKGEILFPGDGDGRNSIYAAKLGWKTYAIDYSEEAINKNKRNAENENVIVNHQILDLSKNEFGDNLYDCIVSIFVHLDEEGKKVYHSNIYKALKPGGVLILQAYDHDQLKYNSGGPKDISLLYSLEEIVTDFQDMDFIVLAKEVIRLKEGKLHDGEASVINFVGKK
ncbi:MAG: class I SAM-dependent methyltransferase [Melioribacteraceae bacterium]|jgi:cyclopropane fatty-acyl-phospholipid synthase-like methyltransferase|nr:class I SAM-dependent methyltransferase [Melioribacteraceae bacterium]